MTSPSSALILWQTAAVAVGPSYEALYELQPLGKHLGAHREDVLQTQTEWGWGEGKKEGLIFVK